MDVEECIKEWEDLIVDYKRLEVLQFYIKHFRNFLYFLFNLCNIISYANIHLAVYIQMMKFYNIPSSFNNILFDQ